MSSDSSSSSSSLVTMSGANGIDWNTIIDAEMTQEKQPLTALQTQESNLSGKKTQYGTLLSDLQAVQDAAQALSSTDTFADRTATSTDSTIASISANSDALIGSYDVVVSKLARAQVTTSATTYADKDTTVVATGGSLKIGDQTLTISKSMTLSDLASAINDMDNGPAKASVVTTNGSYQLVLTGTSTGKSNAFAVDTSGLTGSTLTFNSTNSMDAQDAEFTVNNVAITSDSNSVDNVIPGTTLTLVRQDPATTVAITVGQSLDSTQTKIQSFVTAYNSLLSYVSSQRTAAVGGDASSIGNESIVRGLKSAIGNVLSQSMSSGTFKNLSEIGLEFQSDGTLKFNSTTFKTNVTDTDGQQALETLLAGTSSTDGVFDKVYDSLKAYTEAGGIVPSEQTNLTSQISHLDKRISDMQTKLDLKQEELRKEYAAADSILTQLNSQSSALSSLT